MNKPGNIKKTFQESMAEEAKWISKKVFREDVEIVKCKRSILMHNADKWVEVDRPPLNTVWQGGSQPPCMGCVVV